MALAEDAASVLEQFVQDVANLPAEIAHLLEEIQAKDRIIAEQRSVINARDTSIQKYLKTQNLNCSNPHPKDDAYCKAAIASFDRAQTAQNEKVALSDKAAILLDRQIKRLDFKIRDLQNEGAIQPDPQLPSLLTNTTLSTRLPPLSSATSTGTSTPLHSLGGGAAPSTTIGNNPLTRLVQPAGNAHRHPSPLPSTATHNNVAAHNLNNVRQANRRSPSIDPNKRRRLNSNHLNAPVTSSSLRQSSLGPGTPRGGVDGNSRGSSAGPARPPKKGGPASRTGTGLQNASSANANNANNSGAGISTTVTASKKSLAAAARRRANKKSSTPASNQENSAGDEDVEMEDAEDENDEGEEEEEEEEEEDAADDKKYCTCRSVSYGNMVACDNEACPYEWFHWSCVGIKAEPAGKWFCPDCRTKTREGRVWNDSLKGHHH